MMNPQLIIHIDHVMIFGQRVNRPDSTSPKQWLEFWEQVGDERGGYDDGYDDGYAQGSQMASED